MEEVERAQYVAGLRELADLLDTHPELKLPIDGTLTAIGIVTGAGEHKEQLREFLKYLRSVDKEYFGSRLCVKTRLGGSKGLLFGLNVSRDEVCTRRVVGKRVVETRERDPKLLAKIPYVDVRVEEDIVEWECEPLLKVVDR